MINNFAHEQLLRYIYNIFTYLYLVFLMQESCLYIIAHVVIRLLY